MSGNCTLLLVLILAVSSLIVVKLARASTTKPSVPEFAVKLIDSSCDVPTSYSIDPYTGENVTHTGYHVESRTMEVRIKNQPFTPYEIQENGNNWTINFFYNIRVKGHFSEDWIELENPSDGFLIQSDSEYTVTSFTSTGGDDFYGSHSPLIHAPVGGQVDFQVEAMIGYVHREISTPVPGTGWVLTGETSGWSNTQTLTIREAQQSEPFPTAWIIAAGVVIAVGIVAFLVYFRRIRKPDVKNEKPMFEAKT